MASPRKFPTKLNNVVDDVSTELEKETLPETALGLTKEGDHFYVVVLKYNPATGEAKVHKKDHVGVLAIGANDKFKQSVIKYNILKRY